MITAEQIGALIQEQGLTSYRIAKDTGVSEATLSRYLRGRGGISLETLELILGRLGYELTIRRKRNG